MNILRRQMMVLAVRAYAVAALISVILMSPPLLSGIPILLTAAYIFILWRGTHTATSLLMNYFVFFAIGLLLTQALSPLLSTALALPLLVSVTVDLQTYALSAMLQPSVHKRGPTRICVVMALIAVLMLCVGLLFNNAALRLTSLTASVYLAALIIIAVRKIPVVPVTVDRAVYRIVAGAHDNISITITSNTKYGSILFLRSSGEWVKVREPKLLMNGSALTTSLSISPSLSGPTSVILDGHVIDRWGLTYTNLSVEALRLNVIPRARYAAWLAKKYLAETRAGTLPLVSSVAAIKLATGLNRGIEYYGSKLYQPGDNLKNIDWKHSIKYSKLITKEFAEVQGQEAILLINLAVGNAEEADKQAYNIITAAISLAREQIPGAIAAYDEKDVVLATGRLTSQQLVLQTLDVAQRIVMVHNPLRYLGQPDTQRLRANISRLRSADGEASLVLSKLLQIEYENLNDSARLNPAAKAIAEVSNKMGQQTCIVIISQSNHDAEALDFLKYSRSMRGDSVVVV